MHPHSVEKEACLIRTVCVEHKKQQFSGAILLILFDRTSSQFSLRTNLLLPQIVKFDFNHAAAALGGDQRHSVAPLFRSMHRFDFLKHGGHSNANIISFSVAKLCFHTRSWRGEGMNPKVLAGRGLKEQLAKKRQITIKFDGIFKPHHDGQSRPAGHRRPRRITRMRTARDFQ